jgi:sulfite reductase alpha subunit-like flavoprotein
VWPGMKMTFFSSVMLWMLYKWYKKRQLTDVFIPSISNQNQNFFKIFLILCSHVKPKASSVSIQCDSADMTSIKILYGSVTGKAKYFAHQFQKQCTARGFSSTRVIDLKDYEPEDSLMNDAKSKTIFVVFISTYTEGACPENAKWFHKYITEMAHDFRFEKDKCGKDCKCLNN